MSALIVIPARHASTRLPGKPLLRQTGKYLIQHVYERACLSEKASAVVVATDDPRIVAAVESFGGDVAMTRRDHPSGTDRVAEVARRYPHEIVINLQGDEPLIDPGAIDQLIDLLRADPAAQMATLATPIHSAEQWRNPACVKVVCDDAGSALYFSRSPLPFVRDGAPDFAARPARFFQHVGLYGYRRSALFQFAALPPAAVEQLEKLEQLRALAAGWRIRVGAIDEPSLGVDTYEDYQRFLDLYRGIQRGRAA
jgi:3-deoxy-manno-octulosonate cytidylyltransferase (CMP-KDO synthetase)